MAIRHTEIEVKFHVARLKDLEERIRQRGATLEHPRVHETNLRFDTLDGDLERGQRALRLRHDTVVRLTYKGPGDLEDGIRRRPEVEVQVDDFDRARAFLEGLGYVVVFRYEKYRTTYERGSVTILLDELPYGDFVELEGNAELLRPLAAMLGLKWEAALPLSYHMLFEALKANRHLTFADLTFINFSQSAARIGDLGVVAADG